MTGFVARPVLPSLCQINWVFGSFGSTRRVELKDKFGEGIEVRREGRAFDQLRESLVKVELSPVSSSPYQAIWSLVIFYHETVQIEQMILYTNIEIF